VARRASSKSNPLRRKLLIWLLLIGTICAGLGCVVYGIWASLYNIKDVERIPERSIVFDMDGKPYSRLAGDNRTVVPIEKVSTNFINALLAREDTRFYKHHGVDPLGIARAMVRNAIHLRISEGGSTLTQQLALNTFLGGRHNHSIHRKILEAFLAVRIEQNYSKRSILEYYVNRIYFGSGVYGVETASQTYFAKSAAQLNLSEAAILVGIIRSPTRFSPAQHLDKALTQRDTVLHRMAELGMIKEQAAQAAIDSRPTISNRRSVNVQANYAMDLVHNDLDTILGDEYTDEGLRIYTTIDPVLQKEAQVHHRPGTPEPPSRRAEANRRHPHLSAAGGGVAVAPHRLPSIRRERPKVSASAAPTP